MNIKQKDINKFFKLANDLKVLIEDIQQYCGDAQYYVSDSSLHLMKGESHDCNSKPIQSNSVAEVEIGSLGGGSW